MVAVGSSTSALPSKTAIDEDNRSPPTADDKPAENEPKKTEPKAELDSYQRTSRVNSTATKEENKKDVEAVGRARQRKTETPVDDEVFRNYPTKEYSDGSRVETRGKDDRGNQELKVQRGGSQRRTRDLTVDPQGKVSQVDGKKLDAGVEGLHSDGNTTFTNKRTGRSIVEVSDGSTLGYGKEGRLQDAEFANGTRFSHAYDDAGKRTSTKATRRDQSGAWMPYDLGGKVTDVDQKTGAVTTENENTVRRWLPSGETVSREHKSGITTISDPRGLRDEVYPRGEEKAWTFDMERRQRGRGNEASSETVVDRIGHPDGTSYKNQGRAGYAADDGSRMEDVAFKGDRMSYTAVDKAGGRTPVDFDFADPKGKRTQQVGEGKKLQWEGGRLSSAEHDLAKNGKWSTKFAYDDAGSLRSAEWRSGDREHRIEREKDGRWALHQGKQKTPLEHGSVALGPDGNLTFRGELDTRRFTTDGTHVRSDHRDRPTTIDYGSGSQARLTYDGDSTQAKSIGLYVPDRSGTQIPAETWMRSGDNTYHSADGKTFRGQVLGLSDGRVVTRDQLGERSIHSDGRELGAPRTQPTPLSRVDLSRAEETKRTDGSYARVFSNKEGAARVTLGDASGQQLTFDRGTSFWRDSHGDKHSLEIGKDGLRIDQVTTKAEAERLPGTTPAKKRIDWRHDGKDSIAHSVHEDPRLALRDNSEFIPSNPGWSKEERARAQELARSKIPVGEFQRKKDGNATTLSFAPYRPLGSEERSSEAIGVSAFVQRPRPYEAVARTEEARYRYAPRREEEVSMRLERDDQGGLRRVQMHGQQGEVWERGAAAGERGHEWAVSRNGKEVAKFTGTVEDAGSRLVQTAHGKDGRVVSEFQYDHILASQAYDNRIGEMKARTPKWEAPLGWDSGKLKYQPTKFEIDRNKDLKMLEERRQKHAADLTLGEYVSGYEHLSRQRLAPHERVNDALRSQLSQTIKSRFDRPGEDKRDRWEQKHPMAAKADDALQKEEASLRDVRVALAQGRYADSERLFEQAFGNGSEVPPQERYGQTRDLIRDYKKATPNFAEVMSRVERSVEDSFKDLKESIASPHGAGLMVGAAMFPEIAAPVGAFAGGLAAAKGIMTGTVRFLDGYLNGRPERMLDAVPAFTEGASEAAGLVLPPLAGELLSGRSAARLNQVGKIGQVERAVEVGNGLTTGHRPPITASGRRLDPRNSKVTVDGAAVENRLRDYLKQSGVDHSVLDQTKVKKLGADAEPYALRHDNGSYELGLPYDAHGKVRAADLGHEAHHVKQMAEAFKSGDKKRIAQMHEANDAAKALRDLHTEAQEPGKLTEAMRQKTAKARQRYEGSVVEAEARSAGHQLAAEELRAARARGEARGEKFNGDALAKRVNQIEESARLEEARAAREAKRPSTKEGGEEKELRLASKKMRGDYPPLPPPPPPRSTVPARTVTEPYRTLPDAKGKPTADSLQAQFDGAVRDPKFTDVMAGAIDDARDALASQKKKITPDDVQKVLATIGKKRGKIQVDKIESEIATLASTEKPMPGETQQAFREDASFYGRPLPKMNADPERGNTMFDAILPDNGHRAFMDRAKKTLGRDAVGGDPNTVRIDVDGVPTDVPLSRILPFEQKRDVGPSSHGFAVQHPDFDQSRKLSRRAYEIFADVLNDKSLSEAQAMKKIAEANFLMMHGTPFMRGSPASVEALNDAIMRARFGKTFPKKAKGVEPFWEAMFARPGQQGLDDFVARYRSFYE